MLYRTDVETNQADLISCQTCGRPNYDLWGVVREIKEYTKSIKFSLKIVNFRFIVNGNSKGLIFKKEKFIKIMMKKFSTWIKKNNIWSIFRTSK